MRTWSWSALKPAGRRRRPSRGRRRRRGPRSARACSPWEASLEEEGRPTTVRRLRSVSVRNCEDRAIVLETSARLLHLLSLLQSRREWAGRRPRRPPRGRAADGAPRRRPAARPRLSDRRHARRRGRVPAGRGRRAPAAAARRGGGGRGRGRAARRGERGRDRDRGDLGARARQARAGPPHAPAPPRRRAAAPPRCPTRSPAEVDAGHARRDRRRLSRPRSGSRFAYRAHAAAEPRRRRTARPRPHRPALVPRRLGHRARGLAHVPRRPHRGGAGHRPPLHPARAAGRGPRRVRVARHRRTRDRCRRASSSTRRSPSCAPASHPRSGRSSRSTISHACC